MKHRLLKTLTSLVLAVFMVISMMPAIIITTSADASVTLSFAGGSGTNIDPLEFTDDASGVSAVFTVGTHSTKPRWDAACVRFYGTTAMSNNLTVSAPSGSTITSIVFEMNGSYTLDKVSADSGTIDTATYTWTGDAETVVFTTTAQTRFNGVTVTYGSTTEGGHTHSYAWNGTVGADGSHTLECSNEDGLCDVTTKVADCDWNDGEVTSDADCETEGVKTFTCTVCGGTKTEAIEMTDHTYENGSCIVCGAEEPSTPKYVLTDLADITANMTVIIVAKKSDGTTYALPYSNGSSSAPTAFAVTVNGDTITTDEEVILWNIANDSGNLTIYPAGQTDTWLYCLSSNNGVRVGTNANKIFTLDTSGYLKNTATSRYLGVYNSQDWRCYSNTTGNTAGQTFAFYVLSTELSSCDHNWENDGEPTQPTCTDDGAQPQKCTLCGETKSLAIAATGHTLVDGVCSVCTADFNYTIPEALEAADGTDVIVKGTVCLINEAWNSTYNNMSVTIKDADGNELYLYRLATQVAVGDIITVTGQMGTYNGTRQIAQGATAEITGHEEVEVVYDEVTIPEIIGSDDGRLVTFSGTVIEIGTAWNGSNMSITVTDADGNTIYLYKLASEVALGDVITVKGIVDSYNNEKQIASATAEITGFDESVIAPKFIGFSISLNKGITVKVSISIDAAWLAANAGAKIVFSNGTELDAVAGTNVVYSTNLTPGQINDDLTVTFNGTVVDVSFAAYKTKAEASTNYLGLSETKYAALITLLGEIQDYANAADGNGTEAGNLDSVADISKTDTNGMFAGISASLGDTASFKIGINGDVTGYTVVVTLGGNEIVNGDLASYISINGLYPVHFNDEIVITISDANGVVATAEFTFNSCLKSLYNYTGSSDAVKQMAVATYNYGVAVEAFVVAE